MPPERPRQTLTIPNDLRMLNVARAFVEAVCQSHELQRNVTHAVVLATSEAVSNIVRHAHQNRTDAQIEIHCCVTDTCVEIALFDEGEPFDLCSVPELDPAELRIGGRGVFLMRALMDELLCERHGERGNVLRMSKRVSRPDAIRECG